MRDNDECLERSVLLVANNWIQEEEPELFEGYRSIRDLCPQPMDSSKEPRLASLDLNFCIEIKVECPE